MQYRKDKKGNELSVLGYGCMRFTRKGSGIDLRKAEQEVMYAIRSGVNYFDTAYIYPGSEAALGEILHKNNCRKDVYIATKLPHYMIKSIEGVEKTFQEELRRLQTDYIDYYLMHMLTDTDTWEKLKHMGILDWIAAKMESGAIRNIGFSYHGHTEMFQQLVDAYDWDFCQIQYNYMDREHQAGEKGYALAERLGVPMVIMEPIKGGSLAVLPEDIAAMYKNADPQASVSSWALRWVGTHPNVKVILSGMSTYDQVLDNLNTFENYKSLNVEEQKLVDQVAKTIKSRVKNGCTGCRYCMPCPFGIDIPKNFAIWNHEAMYGNPEAAKKKYERELSESARADQCRKCGACEKECPQAIAIRQDLVRVAEDFKNM